MIHGKSRLFCQAALFRYCLEHFPIKMLHPGLALQEIEGILNIQNSTCYIWPETNNCEPGDHFTKKQIQ